MAKRLLKIFAALLIIIGGAAVVADFFGTGTAPQYLFNIIYFALILPASVAMWFKARGLFEGIRA